MDLYKISVIVPTYNRSELLRYTLSSLKKQKFKEPFEVIVIDDGSNDDSYDVVMSFKSKLDVKYFFQENKGYRVASARNVGINNAKGTIIVFVDSGILLSENCLNNYVSRFDNVMNKVVLGYMFGLDEKERMPISHSQINLHSLSESLDSFKQDGVFLDIRERIFFECEDDLALLPAPWAISWTGNLAVPRRYLIEEDGFDTNYDGRWGMEDIDLGYRLYRRGLSFELGRDCEAIHYPHENDVEMKFSEEKINKEYFAKKFNDSFSNLFLSIEHSLDFNRMYRSRVI